MNYGTKVMGWLATAAGRREEASWELDGLRQSLRRTLSWLGEGRTIYEIPPSEYVCIRTAAGRTEVRRGTERVGALPLRAHLERAGIHLNPGEGFLLEPALVSGLLEEQLRVRETLDPARETRVRHVGSLIPPGAGLPA